jgi:resuscitation-promoting factor RpfA
MTSHRYSGPRHARPSGPRHARPAPPSTAHRSIAATGVAAALAFGETLVTAGGANAVTPDTWAKLRMCESSNRYAVNTGNGYYGAYQFNLATWQGLGYTGLPSDAAPAVQDQAAQRLYDQRGWEPWPACSAKLGLVDDRTASRNTPRPPLPSPSPSATPAPTASASAPATPVVATTPVTTKPVAKPVAKPVTTNPVTTNPVSTAPTATSVPAAATGPWDGHYLTVRDVGTVRGDVTAWQTQMVADGYHISIDGRYGPQSAAAATQFEIDHGLSVEHPGIVGPQIWGTLFAK